MAQGDTAASYTYDGAGLRQSKTVNGVTTSFVLNGMYVGAETSGGTSTYYSRGANLISRSTGGSKDYYYMNSHGDVTKLVNGSGSVVADYAYDAFGNQTGEQADTNPFRYCGEYFDNESGLLYLRARYYDAGVGAFTSADTHWNVGNMIYGDDPDQDNPFPNIFAILQSGNLYGYCMGNPVMFVDSTGNYCRDAAVSYARTWAYGRNNYFYVYTQDCTNFVSQCLFAGGIKMNSRWHSYAYPKAGRWEGRNNEKYNWDITPSWRQAQALYNFLTDPANGYIWSDVVSIRTSYGVKWAANKCGIQPGDVLFLAGSDGSNPHHAMIVTKVENGEIYYAGHTNNRKDQPLSEVMGDEEVKVIRIRNEAVLGYKL